MFFCKLNKKIRILNSHKDTIVFDTIEKFMDLHYGFCSFRDENPHTAK